MKYRTLGKTGVKVSEIGIGTWQLGGSDWGDISEKEGLSILHKSVEMGVNFIDTADVYGMGRSERIIGKFLKETKETVYVATKLGRRQWIENNLSWPTKYTIEMVKRDIEDSLRNLGVDSIFLQQWHCIPTEMLKSGDVFELLEEFKKKGLIQHWGCSIESIEEGLTCMEHPDCETLQVIFNIFRQKVATELLPVAKKKNVGILTRVPLASGLLTGKFKKGHRFPEKDHRNYNADGAVFNIGETFAGVPFDRGVQLAEKIKEILKPSDEITMAQLALRWILDHNEVSTVIPGATRVSQAINNAMASSLPNLSRDAHEKLRKLYKEEIEPCIRGKY
ncbi:MAG: aldo/keto reductase [Candidatus Omnitrophica bacterium]|nr:aldo/keto reductase [Candidatus Omnitrophota bacterium]